MAKKQAKPPKLRVGLLGESPNDTTAVAKLLAPRYGDRVEFFPLVDGITGNDLDNAGTFKILRREYQYERPALVIVIRDLDALETNHAQLRKRRDYLKRVKKQVDDKALYLLNIYSIEALLVADINRFNRYYGSAYVVEGDVMLLVEPVELLKAATKHCKRHYVEGNCGNVLALADYDKLLANCRYFQQFDRDWAAWLAQRAAAPTQPGDQPPASSAPHPRKPERDKR